MRRGIAAHVFVCVVLAVLAALLPSGASAAKPVSGKTVTIGSGQTINDDIYAIGQKVVVDGRVNGNVITAGGAVRVNGTVTGSVITAGGSVRVAGHVGKDLTVATGKLTVDRGATVGRDLLSAAGSTVIDGRLGRNVQVFSGSTRLGSGAVVGGDLKYWGENRAKIAQGAVVRGTVTHERGGGAGFLSGAQLPVGAFSLLVWIRTLIGVLALGLLFVWLAPAFARRSSDTLAARPGGSVGWGIAALIGIPILAVLIFIAGLFVGGWWLSLMMLAVYWIAIVLSIVVTGLFIGRWFLARTGGNTASLPLAMAIGVALLLVVSIVPIVGGIIMFVSLLLGLGALLLAGFRSSQRSAREPVRNAA